MWAFTNHNCSLLFPFSLYPSVCPFKFIPFCYFRARTFMAYVFEKLEAYILHPFMRSSLTIWHKPQTRPFPALPLSDKCKSVAYNLFRHDKTSGPFMQLLSYFALFLSSLWNSLKESVTLQAFRIDHSPTTMHMKVLISDILTSLCCASEFVVHGRVADWSLVLQLQLFIRYNHDWLPHA